MGAVVMAMGPANNWLWNSERFLIKLSQTLSCKNCLNLVILCFNTPVHTPKWRQHYCQQFWWSFEWIVWEFPLKGFIYIWCLKCVVTFRPNGAKMSVHHTFLTMFLSSYHQEIFRSPLFFFSQENAFGNIVDKILAILFMPQCFESA